MGLYFKYLTNNKLSANTTNLLHNQTVEFSINVCTIDYECVTIVGDSL